MLVTLASSMALGIKKNNYELVKSKETKCRKLMFGFDNKGNLPEQSYARYMPSLVLFMIQFLL